MNKKIVIGLGLSFFFLVGILFLLVTMPTSKKTLKSEKTVETNETYENAKNALDGKTTDVNEGNSDSVVTSVIADNSNTSVTMDYVSGPWSDDKNNDICQYKVTVKNISNSAISNWKVKVDFGSLMTFVGCTNWNNQFSFESGYLYLTAADGVGNIEPNAEYSFEFQITYTGTIGNPVVTIE